MTSVKQLKPMYPLSIVIAHKSSTRSQHVPPQTSILRTTMKLLFISSVLAIATSAAAADVSLFFSIELSFIAMIIIIVIDCNRFTFSLTNHHRAFIVLFQQVNFLRTANRSGKCDWETSRAASSGEDCDDEGDRCTPGGSTGRGSCCSVPGKNLICNHIHSKFRSDGVGGHFCVENPGEEDVAAAFEKELKLVEEEDRTCMPQDASGGEGKCGCKTGPTGGNPDGTPCCSGSTCNGVAVSGGEATFTCEPPTHREEDVAVEDFISRLPGCSGSRDDEGSCCLEDEPCHGHGNCCNDYSCNHYDTDEDGNALKRCEEPSVEIY